MEKTEFLFVSILVFVLFGKIEGYAQKSDPISDYKLIRSITDNSADYFEKFDSTRTGNEILSTSYTVEVDARNKESISTECFILYDGERSRFSVSDVIVVQDSKVGLQIQQEARQIVIHEADEGQSKEYFLQKSNALQDESLQYIESSERTEIEEGIFKIRLEFDPEGRRQLLLSAAEYIVDLENEKILKASIYYTDKHPNQTVSIEFGKVDISEGRSEKLPRNILDLIYDNNGDLLPKYRGFAVFDNRMKK